MLDQDLVEVGFKLATGPVEALRPAGVQLLDQLLATFSDVPDPLLPGDNGNTCDVKMAKCVLCC
jgi:hypothetical protein